MKRSLKLNYLHTRTLKSAHYGNNGDLLLVMVHQQREVISCINSDDQAQFNNRIQLLGAPIRGRHFQYAVEKALFV